MTRALGVFNGRGSLAWPAIPFYSIPDAAERYGLKLTVVNEASARPSVL